MNMLLVIRPLKINGLFLVRNISKLEDKTSRKKQKYNVHTEHRTSSSIGR